MLTDEEIKKLVKKIEKGAKYLEKYDDLGATFPDKRKPATFTISAETLEMLEGLENKSEFVEKAIKEKLEAKA